jgi:hypothetical protein
LWINRNYNFWNSFGILFLDSAKSSRLKCKRVHKGIRISESNNLARTQRFPSIHQTIIIRESFEQSRIDYSCRSKPATMKMDIMRSTTRNTSVDNLHNVLWNSRSWTFALWDTNVSFCAITWWKNNNKRFNFSPWKYRSVSYLVSKNI